MEHVHDAGVVLQRGQDVCLLVELLESEVVILYFHGARVVFPEDLDGHIYAAELNFVHGAEPALAEEVSVDEHVVPVDERELSHDEGASHHVAGVLMDVPPLGLGQH